MQSSPPISPLLCLAVPIVGSATVVCAWLILRKRQKTSVGESRCGRCGYIVKGLTSMTCPECGSDLREVGIISASVPRPNSIFRYAKVAALLAVWTLIVVLQFIICWAPFDPYHRQTVGLIDANLWPYHGQSKHSVILTPRSGAYRQLVITENRTVKVTGMSSLTNFPWTGNNGREGNTRFEINVQVEPLTGPTSQLTIDVLKDMSCTYTVQGGQPITRAIHPDALFLTGWLKDAGIDVALPSVKQEVEVALDLIDTSASQGWIGTAWHSDDKPTGRLAYIAQNQWWDHRETYPFTRHVGSESFQFGPAFNINWIGVPFTLLLWVGGIHWIIRRRAMQSPESTVVQPAATQLPITQPAVSTSRTLTVMFTDIKDYTARSAAESRVGIIDLIRRHRDLVEPIAKQHGGRIVKGIGDALLLTFDSATDAILSGIEIQRVLGANNLASLDRERFELRIGMSTGEVTLEQSDVYGEPVNLASRVQQLGTPGQVLFTAATLAMIKRQEITFDKLGSFELKGIDHSVDLFTARPKMS